MLGRSFYTREAEPLREPTADGHQEIHTNIGPLRQTFCSQVEKPNTECILTIVSLGKLFATRRFPRILLSSKNLTNTTFIREIG